MSSIGVTCFSYGGKRERERNEREEGKWGKGKLLWQLKKYTYSLTNISSAFQKLESKVQKGSHRMGIFESWITFQGR